MTNELKYLLGGLIGFGLAVPAGIIQADMAMNRVLHNTQWIIPEHMYILQLLFLTLYDFIFSSLCIMASCYK